MIKTISSVCIDASPERVWRFLADLPAIALWSEPVLEAACPPGKDRGVGAERMCRLAGDVTIVERWTHWTEGQTFHYEGVGIPLVKRAGNRWSVHAEPA